VDIVAANPGPRDMPGFLKEPKSPVISPPLSFPEIEKEGILAALASTNGDRGRAARVLQTSRTTLYRKMKQYGIG
jgi:transcriptional regulator of acetoin/glycerol metabolism